LLSNGNFLHHNCKSKRKVTLPLKENLEDRNRTSDLRRIVIFSGLTDSAFLPRTTIPRSTN
jgi:hypothetical protein